MARTVSVRQRGRPFLIAGMGANLRAATLAPSFRGAGQQQWTGVAPIQRNSVRYPHSRHHVTHHRACVPAISGRADTAGGIVGDHSDGTPQHLQRTTTTTTQRCLLPRPLMAGSCHAALAVLS